MSTVEAVFGFLGILATQAFGFAVVYVQSKGMHAQNIARLDSIIKQFDDHMEWFHRAA